MATGILPLGRPTFDVPYAEARLAAMLARLGDVAGPRHLLMDAGAARAGIAALQAREVDRVLILQVTFTDAEMTAEIAAAFPGLPLMLWAPPEPRTGGRLRLNAFCGLNLAAHALSLRDRRFGWFYADPEDAATPDALHDLLAGGRVADPARAAPAPALPDPAGTAAATALHGRRVGRIGQHPAGFDTCAYDPDELGALTGVGVEPIALASLFDRARAVPDADAAALRARVPLEGLDAVDQAELDRSLRLKCALDGLRAEGRYDAFAIRCWPETFTEYGAAVCGPVGMLGEARIPCACEADVPGAVTQLLLQEIAQAPVFLVDLVDMDPADDTGVVWHCGQAPISMRDPESLATATIHTNRRMPLLAQFTLKPGRVTFVRISRGNGVRKLVLASGEMLRRPMAFTGTSGVVRFDAPAAAVTAGLMDAGMEHHMALAYGDHRTALAGAAAAMGLGVLDLTGDAA